MSSPDLEPLSPEAERLLALEREPPPETAELRARAFARARGAARAHGARAPERQLRRRSAVLLAAALMIAFAAVAFAAWRESLPEPAHPRSATGAANPSANVVKSPAPPGVEATDAEQVSEPTRPVRKAAPPLTSERQPAEDATALELAVLQRARAAVAKREFSVGLALVNEHQRRFPNGKLSEEREALRVKALAGLGRTEEARRAAESFRKGFPNSVLSPRIDATARPAP